MGRCGKRKPTPSGATRVAAGNAAQSGATMALLLAAITTATVTRKTARSRAGPDTAASARGSHSERTLTPRLRTR
jgi:hypothetical protein